MLIKQKIIIFKNLWNWHNENPNKKIKILLGFFLGLLFFSIVGKYYACPIKYFFGIPCPGCGLTRAFKCILKLDFIGALHFNILSPFIFLWFLLVFFMNIHDLILSTEYVDKFLHIKFKLYHYIIGVGLMLVSLILNITRGI